MSDVDGKMDNVSWEQTANKGCSKSKTTPATLFNPKAEFRVCLEFTGASCVIQRFLVRCLYVGQVSCCPKRRDDWEQLCVYDWRSSLKSQPQSFHQCVNPYLLLWPDNYVHKKRHCSEMETSAFPSRAISGNKKALIKVLNDGFMYCGWSISSLQL